MPKPARTPVVPAFETVFVEFGAYVLGLVRRLGVDPEDVEDVAQEVFLVVHRGLPGFEGRSSIKTWVCGICLRTASHYRRARGRRRERAHDPLPTRAIAPEQEEVVAEAQIKAQLERALLRLPEPQREVFVLFELQEMSMEEVAVAMGCSASTAYGRLYAARTAIQAHLQRERRREPA